MRETEVALYRPDARSGARPIVLFPVEHGSLVGKVESPGPADVRGTPAPGRALALVVADEVFCAVGPARAPLVWTRRHRL